MGDYLSHGEGSGKRINGGADTEEESHVAVPGDELRAENAHRVGHGRVSQGQRVHILFGTDNVFFRDVLNDRADGYDLRHFIGERRVAEQAEDAVGENKVADLVDHARDQRGNGVKGVHQPHNAAEGPNPEHHRDRPAASVGETGVDKVKELRDAGDRAGHEAKCQRGDDARAKADQRAVTHDGGNENYDERDHHVDGDSLFHKLKQRDSRGTLLCQSRPDLFRYLRDGVGGLSGRAWQSHADADEVEDYGRGDEAEQRPDSLVADSLDYFDLLDTGADDRRIGDKPNVVAEAGAAGDGADGKRDVAADDMVKPEEDRRAGCKRSPRGPRSYREDGGDEQGNDGENFRVEPRGKRHVDDGGGNAGSHKAFGDGVGGLENEENDQEVFQVVKSRIKAVLELVTVNDHRNDDRVHKRERRGKKNVHPREHKTRYNTYRRKFQQSFHYQ